MISVLELIDWIPQYLNPSDRHLPDCVRINCDSTRKRVQAGGTALCKYIPTVQTVATCCRPTLNKSKTEANAHTDDLGLGTDYLGSWRYSCNPAT